MNGFLMIKSSEEKKIIESEWIGSTWIGIDWIEEKDVELFVSD